MSHYFQGYSASFQGFIVALKFIMLIKYGQTTKQENLEKEEGVMCHHLSWPLNVPPIINPWTRLKKKQFMLIWGRNDTKQFPNHPWCCTNLKYCTYD